MNNLINPLVGAIVGKTNLANMFVAIPPGDFKTAAGAQAAGAVVFSYGAFLNAVINFLIVALRALLDRLGGQPRSARRRRRPSTRSAPTA